MTTHSSILAWRILWTEELSGLQSMRSQRVRHDCVTNTWITDAKAMTQPMLPKTVVSSSSPSNQNVSYTMSHFLIVHLHSSQSSFSWNI